MIQRQQSTTAYPVLFRLLDEDGAAVEGVTPTVTISKAGAAYEAAAGAVTELDNGVYSWAGHATDRATLGTLAVHIEAAGATTLDGVVEIVAHDPFQDMAKIIAGTHVLRADNADGDKTATADSIAAIKAKTDNLPASPAAVGSEMTLTSGERNSIAAAVWGALTSGMSTAGAIGKWIVDNLDAKVSTRAKPSDLSAVATSITVVSPVDINQGDALTVVRGDAYLDAVNNAIEITVVDSRLPADVNSDGSKVSLKISRLHTAGEVTEAAGTIASWTPATSTAILKFDLTSQATSQLAYGPNIYRYDIEWLIEGDATKVLTSAADKPVNVVRDQR